MATLPPSPDAPPEKMAPASAQTSCPDDDLHLSSKTPSASTASPKPTLKHAGYREEDMGVDVEAEPASASYPIRAAPGATGGERGGPAERLWRLLKPFSFPAFWLLMTGWWIAGLNLHRHDIGGPTESWLVPTLLWLALTLRLVTLYLSTKHVTRPVAVVWMRAIYGPAHRIPQKLRLPLAGAGTVAVFLVGTFVTEETADNTRANRAVSLFGLLVFLAGFYVTSKDRKAIRWQTVIVGMLSQYILALFVLRTQAGYDIFTFIAYLASTLLRFADKGTAFLLSEDLLVFHYYILNVIPPIIFFVAFIQLLYYWGWLQWCIGKFATVFFYGMRVSGAEAVAAAASPFVGQGESAMLIKPFIPHLTSAELHQILTSGFATIAGSVLGAYISMGISPLALISSCVMSIPASLAISKLRYPETEEALTAGKIVVPADTDARPSNGLHAFANGSWLGMRVGGMIIAALLCILALLGLANGLLGWWGRYLNIDDPLSVELIVGYIFYPVAFLLGVPRDRDIFRVSKLIGLKIVANEFVAFAAMVDTTPGNDFLNLSARSRLIATYAVCGFGNISSVGIQIGVLSSLGGDAGRIAKIAFSALISGVIATLTSASIAGMLIKDTAAYVAVTATP
ncbi:hypothetical protein B2J93_2648 [Marssonina coronariae]|uniref:H+ nucleoside cotransporter n=1 Tax=Diplocarpon coronariae TaxID=2795749 RepID=A0A218Z8E2_9HELO|nr:hypothetical protein B2J93_2648 [Marssonina coronariae]